MVSLGQINPLFGLVDAVAKTLVSVAGGLIGMGGGSAAVAPPSDPPAIDPDPSVLDPIIQPMTAIVGADATVLIVVGVALLALYGVIALIRGPRA